MVCVICEFLRKEFSFEWLCKPKPLNKHSLKKKKKVSYYFFRWPRDVYFYYSNQSLRPMAAVLAADTDSSSLVKPATHVQLPGCCDAAMGACVTHQGRVPASLDLSHCLKVCVSPWGPPVWGLLINIIKPMLSIQRHLVPSRSSAKVCCAPTQCLAKPNGDGSRVVFLVCLTWLHQCFLWVVGFSIGVLFRVLLWPARTAIQQCSLSLVPLICGITRRKAAGGWHAPLPLGAAWTSSPTPSWPHSALVLFQFFLYLKKIGLRNRKRHA